MLCAGARELDSLNNPWSLTVTSPDDGEDESNTQGLVRIIRPNV